MPRRISRDWRRLAIAWYDISAKRWVSRRLDTMKAVSSNELKSSDIHNERSSNVDLHLLLEKDRSHCRQINVV